MMIPHYKRMVKKILKVLNINLQAPVLGINKANAEQFFKKLDEKSINYVILRWYDFLPYSEPGEDFDILVSNNDCNRLKKLLVHGNVTNKNFIKCDIYPVNNVKGFLAYYPPVLAKKCLSDKEKKNGVWTMNPETYFYSLTYHALFHKGYSSGIKSRYGTSEMDIISEHDYPNILINMAAELGINTKGYLLEDYLDLLKQADWMPPMDILFRRSQKNKWIYDYLKATLPSEWFERRGLVCFVVREKGDEPKYVQVIKDEISKKGAQIIKEIALSKDQKKYFATYTRGGDWEKGPAKVGGGLPSRILIVKKSDGDEKDIIPHGVVEYSWVKEIKETIRAKYNKSVPYSQSSNILHSTDNGVEASYYIRILSLTVGKDESEFAKI